MFMSLTMTSICRGALAVLLVLLGNALYQLRGGIEQAFKRGETAREMILATYTLRQSSDYLTRYARHFVVTGDPAYRDIFQQVLNIRRGESLRPKINELLAAPATAEK